MKRANKHLFDIIRDCIDLPLIRIQKVTHVVECLHRFGFMLKAESCPMIDVLIDELQEQLDLTRLLGTKLGTEHLIYCC